MKITNQLLPSILVLLSSWAAFAVNGGWSVPAQNLSFEGVMLDNTDPANPVPYNFAAVPGGSGVYFQILVQPSGQSTYCLVYEEGNNNNFTTGDIVQTLSPTDSNVYYNALSGNWMSALFYSSASMNGYSENLSVSNAAIVGPGSLAAGCTVPAGDQGSRILRIIVTNQNLISTTSGTPPPPTSSIKAAMDVPITSQPYSFLSQLATGITGTNTNFQIQTGADGPVYSMSNLFGTTGIANMNAASPSYAAASASTSYPVMLFNGTNWAAGNLTAGGGLTFSNAGNNIQISVAESGIGFNGTGTASSSDTTGALVVTGGEGILQNLNVGGTIGAGGAISGASVAATGAVSGGSLSSSGAISGASVTATGAISAGSVTSSGALSGASLAVSGAITTASLTASAGVSAASVTASGALSGASISSGSSIAAVNDITTSTGKVQAAGGTLGSTAANGVTASALTVGGGTKIGVVNACTVTVASGLQTGSAACGTVTSSSGCVCTPRSNSPPIGVYIDSVNPSAGNLSVYLNAVAPAAGVTVSCICTN